MEIILFLIYRYMNVYYVYVYLDPRKPGSFIFGEYEFNFEPFYIGKGSGERYKMHLYESVSIRNTPKLNKIRSILSVGLKPIILKYFENMSECEAFKLEGQMIKTIGRRDKNEGTLVNLCDGEFEKNITYTDEMRKKISDSLKKSTIFQKISRSEEKAIRTGKSLKDYYSKNTHVNKGVSKSKEQIEKIKEKMSIIYKIENPDCDILSFRGSKEVSIYFKDLNNKLGLKGRFKISSDSILYKNGSKGYKLHSKDNEYRDMSWSEQEKINNVGKLNKNLCQYEIESPDGEIYIFIGRSEVKKFFKENHININFDRLMNTLESKGFKILKKEKIYNKIKMEV